MRQQDIADKTGITQGKYSGIENGLTDPPLSLARAIADALGHSLDVLWPPKRARRSAKRAAREEPSTTEAAA